jgi:hypothetical protein
LGTSSAGTEFYFSFIPSWASYTNDNLKIYISSNTKTKVIVEVEGKKILEKYTVPNDIIDFKLNPNEGQVMTRTHIEKPTAEKVWKKAAVHIKSEKPIICYGVTRYQYTSDGFLILPVTSLGTEYQVSSYADVSTNAGQWLSSETTITATSDSTELKFIMGGTSTSKTAGNLNPGDTSFWQLDKGDVILVSSLGSMADLSGSKIIASNPVAVVSGNYCAYIPTTCGCCDVIEEMELPTNLWGKTYHVAPIQGRVKSSMIKIFAKEDNTDIYKDYQKIGNIVKAGGIENVGYLHIRADNGNNPTVISSDKPISVTQYNTGQLDDGNVSDPFQMVLVPTELYQYEITFHTPGIRGGFGFPQNYINLVYQATEEDSIPKDLLFAQYLYGKFVWEQLSKKSPNPGKPFLKTDSSNYFTKIISLPGDGVYKIKANKKIQAYSYGFSWCDSYGFPSAVGSTDFQDSAFAKDHLPPIINYEILNECNGDIKGYIKDISDDSVYVARLFSIELIESLSYNYSLTIDNYNQCETDSVSWTIRKKSLRDDGTAVIKITDCDGNDTTITINHISDNNWFIEKDEFHSNISPLDTARKLISIENKLKDKPAVINVIKFKSSGNMISKHSFYLTDKEGKSIELPLIIPPDEKGELVLSYIGTCGEFKDSLGFGDSCGFEYQYFMTSSTYASILTCSDIKFNDTKVGLKSMKKFILSNTGNKEFTISKVRMPQSYELNNGSKVLIFKSDDLDNLGIYELNKLVLQPGESKELEVIFYPLNEKMYIDSIIFTNNSTSINGLTDSVCILEGLGLNTNSIEYDLINSISVYPNPAKDILMLENLPENCDKLLIFDETGKLMKDIVFNSNERLLKISIKDLSQGHYILRIFCDGNIFDKKFIIER